jgi:hypothetical protein
MRNKLIWLTIAVAVVLIAALQVRAYLHLKVRTANQAKAIARQYATRIGWSYEEPSTVRYEKYWSTIRSPLWRVSFSDNKHAYINATSGEAYVLFCLRQSDTESSSKELSEKQAPAIAETFLDKLGRPADCRFKEFATDQLGWTTVWERVYHNIPYRYDEIRISIYPDTGELHHYSKLYTSVPAKSVKIVITQEAAVAKASGTDRKLALIGKPFLAIVPPPYQDKAARKYRNNSPRAAWVIKSAVLGGWGNIEYWIDAETGDQLNIKDNSLYIK